MNYQSIITIEPVKRGGRPCIRRRRTAVADVLGWLVAGMTHQAIIADYSELTEDDILACLAYAAGRKTNALAHSSCQGGSVESMTISWTPSRVNRAVHQGGILLFQVGFLPGKFPYAVTHVLDERIGFCILEKQFALLPLELLQS